MREENINEVRIEEKAKLQAQKKKETTEKEVLKALLVRIKTPLKARKVPVLKKKVISFVNSNINRGVLETLVKQSVIAGPTTQGYSRASTSIG